MTDSVLVLISYDLMIRNLRMRSLTAAVIRIIYFFFSCKHQCKDANSTIRSLNTLSHWTSSHFHAGTITLMNGEKESALIVLRDILLQFKMIFKKREDI